MKEIVDLEFKGYRIELYSEELGYNDIIVLPKNLEKTIEEIQKNAKKIISDIPYDEISIYNVYEIHPSKFGKISFEDYINVLGIKESFFEEEKEKIKIYFNPISENLHKLKSKKLDNFKINLKNNYLSTPEYIYKIDNKYYLLSEELYEVPKDMYNFIEELISKEIK